MEEADPFHNITCDLHTGHSVQTDLQRSMEVTRVARHDEEDLWRGEERDGRWGVRVGVRRIGRDPFP